MSALSIGVLFAMVAVGRPAAADPLTITDLGTLPGDTDSAVYGLNVAGTVVGQSSAGPAWNATAVHAVSWNADGAITALPLPPGDTDPDSSARAVNDAGVITGTSYNGNVSRTLRWDPDGTVTTLDPLPGDESSRPQAISADGTIIGQSLSSSGVTHAVRWDPDGTVSELPNPYGDTYTYVSAINDDDTITGYSLSSGSPEHALVWHPDGTTTDLSGVLGGLPVLNDAGVVAGVNGANHGIRRNPDGSTVDLGLSAQPAAIGVDGTIVGGGRPDIMHRYPVSWAPDGTATNLSVLPADTNGWAENANIAGTIVGHSSVFVSQYDEQTHAVFWSPAGAVTALGFLPGGTSSDAEYINDVGTIAGVSDNSAGQTHAVIWRGTTW